MSEKASQGVVGRAGKGRKGRKEVEVELTVVPRVDGKRPLVVAEREDIQTRERSEKKSAIGSLRIERREEDLLTTGSLRSSFLRRRCDR